MDVSILVKKAKKGDKDALVQLIMNKKQDYYKLAYVYLKNENDAMDALEDMIVIIYEKINKLKKNDAFYSWSKTILVNCCKKILKDNKKITSLDNIEEPSDYGNIDKKDSQILLESYLSKLNDKHQEVIRLRYFLDLEYEAIADILKIPLGTVKSRISIGLNKLKESFGGEDYERN